MDISKKIFDTVNGKEIYSYMLNDGKISAEVLTFGGIVRSINVLGINGESIDVVLGYNDVETYKINRYFGAIIGRVANRIEKGKFFIGDNEYNIPINNGENALHGGIDGFDQKIWNDEIVDGKLVLTYLSKDKEEGFPGNLFVKVIYYCENGELNIEYEATTDKDTPISLTNHSFFNLNGENSGIDILNIKLKIDSDFVTPVDEKLITHGEFLPVNNTPFDFRTFKEIGKDINADHYLIKNCGGYDLNFALNGEGFRKVAVAKSDITGITLEVFTDQKGVQLYTGNFLKGEKGKSLPYKYRYSFCLETQSYPNAVNCKNYPSVILKKGETYKTKTVYKFIKE